MGSFTPALYSDPSFIIGGAVYGWTAISNPNATVTVKLVKVVTISAGAVAKVSIVVAVAGEATKYYCKLAAGS